MITKRAFAVTLLGGSMAVTGFGTGSAALGSNDRISTQPSEIAQRVVTRSPGFEESLILVVGGLYDSEQEASAAVAASNQGETAGYYLAATDDFRLQAGYASSAPSSSSIPCDPVNMPGVAAQLPELAQVSAAQLQEQCKVAIKAGAGPTLNVARDSRLEWLPVSTKPHGGRSMANPKACEAGSACLGGVPRLLGSSVELPQGKWMAVSAFRTKRGAEEFMTWMRQASGHEPAMVVQVLRVTGTSTIGLGQEAHPDGQGPLNAELPDQARWQR